MLKDSRGNEILVLEVVEGFFSSVVFHVIQVTFKILGDTL
jgi:hypothetical protein